MQAGACPSHERNGGIGIEAISCCMLHPATPHSDVACRGGLHIHHTRTVHYTPLWALAVNYLVSANVPRSSNDSRSPCTLHYWTLPCARLHAVMRAPQHVAFLETSLIATPNVAHYGLRAYKTSRKGAHGLSGHTLTDVVRHSRARGKTTAWT